MLILYAKDMQDTRAVWTVKCCCDRDVWNPAYSRGNRKLANSWYERIP